MQQVLAKEGKAVHMVAVNDSYAAGAQGNFVAKAAFPLFQDTTETTAWTLHGGGKDDIIIYGKDGKLAVFLPYSGPVSTHMATPEGWANVKGAIEKVWAKP